MVSKSKKLFDQAKKIIPSGVNSPVRFFKPYPFFVKKSQGSSIWDEDGRRYIDYCNGYGALLLGHARKEIISAVSSQLKKGTLYTIPTVHGQGTSCKHRCGGNHDRNQIGKRIYKKEKNYQI